MSVNEDDIQQALFAYLAHIEPRIPEVAFIYHVPNGGRRSVATGARLKRLGVKRGVPDIIVPMARQGYHGMAIELKRPDGRLSPHQQHWLAMLTQEQWYAIVCTSWIAAARLIVIYLGHDPTHYGLSERE